MTIATSYEQVTNNSSDGAQVGKGTSEKVAFYGSTPVVQPTGSSQAAVTGTVGTALVTTTATTMASGYASSTQAIAITTRVNQLVVDSLATTILVNKLRADMVALGLSAGS